MKKHLESESSLKQIPQINPCLWFVMISLVFSVAPFKIDRNKNQNGSIDKVQNLGKLRKKVNM